MISESFYGSLPVLYRCLPALYRRLPALYRSLPQLYRSETQFGTDLGTPETVKASKSFRNDWNMFIHALVMAGERLGGSWDSWRVGERFEVDFFAPARFSGIWEESGKEWTNLQNSIGSKKNLEGVRQNPENLAQVHSFLAENAENEVSQSILKFGVDNPTSHQPW